MRYSAIPTIIVVCAATAAVAGEKRGLGAHEHGTGHFNMAVEGTEVAMELEAPGADIVGFEHEATSEEDRAAIEAAKARLSAPLSLFVLPAAAGCEVASVDVALVGDHEHDHDQDHGEDHAGHDHAEHDHAEHDHDHDHDHGHEEAAEAEGGHTEFHAEYRLTCADPTGLTSVDFAYFDAFPNAEKLEIQMIDAEGSRGFEVTREEAVLALPGSS
ncbi:MAG: DUF2796 domain-containing protein [Pseudomonadota bacterium]